MVWSKEALRCQGGSTFEQLLSISGHLVLSLSVTASVQPLFLPHAHRVTSTQHMYV